MISKPGEKDIPNSVIMELLKYNFTLEDEMAKGGFGKIYSIKHKQKHLTLAMKYLAVNSTNIADTKLINQIAKNKEEVTRSSKLKGKNLVLCYGGMKFSADNAFGILMAKAKYNDFNLFIQRYHTSLFNDSYLYSKDKTWFFQHNNNIVKFFFQQVVNGLLCLSRYGYAHLDIKPENLLLDEGFTIKLCDYGQLQELNPPYQTLVELKNGTPCYMSPEYYRNSKNAPRDLGKVDAYALGATIYKMLFNDHVIPKDAKYSQKERKSLITEAVNRVKNAHWINNDLKDLIQRLLNYELRDRASIEEASEHTWFKDQESNSTIKRVAEINHNEQVKLFLQMHSMKGLQLRERKRNTYVIKYRK